METQNRVSLTALYTAQHWIKGGYPFAKYFDTLRGRLVYWLSVLVSRLPFVGQGIRYYNQVLEGDLAFIVSIKKALLEPCLPQENYQLQTVDLLKDSLESLTAGLSPSDRVLVNLTLGSPRLTQLIARVLGVTVEDRMYPTGDAALEDLRACGFATVDKLDHPFDLSPQDLADVPRGAIGWEMVVARKR